MKVIIDKKEYELELLDDSFHLIDSSNKKNQYKIPFNEIMYYKKSNCNDVNIFSKMDYILIVLLLTMPFFLNLQITLISALIYGMVFYLKYINSFILRFYIVDNVKLDLKIFESNIPKLSTLKIRFKEIEDVCLVEKHIKDKIKILLNVKEKTKK